MPPAITASENSRSSSFLCYAKANFQPTTSVIFKEKIFKDFLKIYRQQTQH